MLLCRPRPTLIIIDLEKLNVNWIMNKPCRRRRWSPPCRHRSVQVWNQTSCKGHSGKRWSDISPESESVNMVNRETREKIWILSSSSFIIFYSDERDTRHTSRGVLEAEMAVNPTISLKYMVTESKLSAGTCINSISQSPWKMETRETFKFYLSFSLSSVYTSGHARYSLYNTGIA